MRELRLASLPHILWINLDRSVDRKVYMETELAKYDVSHTRISGCDGKQYDTFSIIDFSDDRYETRGEIGCLCSHFKALEYFLHSMTDEYCLIAEDDLTFFYLNFWKKSFWEYLADLPADWEIVQLSQITKQYSLELRKGFTFGTGLYLVNRRGAAAILASIQKQEDRYILPRNKEIQYKADHFLYRKAVTYTIPLFTYDLGIESMIHPEHVYFQDRSKKALTNLWRCS